METIGLRLGENVVRIFFRRPSPSELIEALVKKMPRGDENEDAGRSLVVNLELGRACVTGVGEGDLAIGNEALVTEAERDGFREDWREVLTQRFPLLLIALGQYLTRLPEFLEEARLKKS
jgi:hypothetical protein